MVMALTRAGEVDDEAALCAERVLAELGATVRTLPPLEDPAYAWDPERKQYSSTLLLREAVLRRPADADRIIVLTTLDLFIPMLSFVYGQAQLDGPAAVVSLARLRQEFYGLPPNDALLLLRLRKELLHELGHTLGLTHCRERLCTMTLSTNIHGLDMKGEEFCSSCGPQVRQALVALHPTTTGGLP